MNNCRLRKLSPCLWPLFLVASLSASFAQEPESWGGFWLEKSDNDDYWPKHFRVGAMAGLNIKADFKMNGTFAVSGYNPGTVAPGADHFYDDGYVRVDETGNAGNLTSYWGYNNAVSQVSGNNLLFHSARTFTANGSTSETGDVQPGLDIAYGTHLCNWGDALIGWELGLGWLATSIEDNNPVAISATRTRHSYNKGTVTLPAAPYNGGFEGPAVVIGDIPTVLADQIINGTVSGHTLDASIYTLRLGPTVYWELPWNFATQLSGGAAVGFVSGDLEYSETLFFPSDGSRAYNRGGVSDDQFVYGGYLSATLMYHVEEHGDLYLGVQYMPMSNATFSGGGREATLDMTGAVYVSFGINWPF